jgi:hypothetical protein
MDWGNGLVVVAATVKQVCAAVAAFAPVHSQPLTIALSCGSASLTAARIREGNNVPIQSGTNFGAGK